MKCYKHAIIVYFSTHYILTIYIYLVLSEGGNQITFRGLTAKSLLNFLGYIQENCLIDNSVFWPSPPNKECEI